VTGKPEVGKTPLVLSRKSSVQPTEAELIYITEDETEEEKRWAQNTNNHSRQKARLLMSP